MAEQETTTLRVWWIPPIPMKPYFVGVRTIEEAALLLHSLAYYDLFQLENNVKPDFSNAGGLEVLVNGEWEEWEHPETYDDIRAWADKNWKPVEPAKAGKTSGRARKAKKAGK